MSTNSRSRYLAAQATTTWVFVLMSGATLRDLMDRMGLAGRPALMAGEWRGRGRSEHDFERLAIWIGDHVADLVTPLVAAFATVGAAIGGPVVTGTIQNRSEARLRKSITDNIDLAKSLSNSPKTAASAELLEHFVATQVEALIRREHKDITKVRDWSSLGVVIFLLAVFGWLPIWLWTFDRWWTSSLAIAIGVILALFIVVGIQSTFWPSERRTKARKSKSDMQ